MLIQKCLSTGIPSKLTQGIWWHRLPACADKGLNLEDITLIFFHKDRLKKLRVINAAPTFNRLLHRLEACATNLK
jgi:hypothetical protein